MSNNSLDETNSVSRSDQVLMWFVVGSLTLIEFALVALVGWLIFASSSSVELLIAMISAVVLVAALIFLTAARLFRVVGLEVTREGIRAELQPLREKIDETKRRIDELFLLSMSGDMFLNLEKLESGRFGYFRKGEGLDRELRHLRSIGYIEVPSFDAIPQEEPDLSEYATIADVGKRFVQERRRLKEEQRSAGNQS
jgi:hypothetical protein